MGAYKRCDRATLRACGTRKWHSICLPHHGYMAYHNADPKAVASMRVGLAIALKDDVATDFHELPVMIVGMGFLCSKSHWSFPQHRHSILSSTTSDPNLKV